MRFGDTILANWTRQTDSQAASKEIPRIEAAHCLKTWMKINEIKGLIGIFHALDIEKFFDKEGLIDTLYTMYRRGKISEKVCRIWFKLNSRTQVHCKPKPSWLVYRL